MVRTVVALTETAISSTPFLNLAARAIRQDQQNFLWTLSPNSLLLADDASLLSYLGDDFGSHYLFLGARSGKVGGFFGALNLSASGASANVLVWIEPALRGTRTSVHWWSLFVATLRERGIRTLSARIKVANKLSLRSAMHLGFEQCRDAAIGAIPDSKRTLVIRTTQLTHTEKWLIRTGGRRP